MSTPKPPIEPESLPQPPWSSERPLPSRPTLTRASITDAALHVVDTEGFTALSMRRLAHELGAVPSALYAHVSGKPELVQLMIDQVAGEVEIPDPDPTAWQEQIKEVMRELYRVLASHRDLAAAFLANIPTGHNALRVMDRFLAILVVGGVPPQAAAYAADLLPMFVTASAYEGSLFAERLEREPDYFPKLHAYMASLPAAGFPVLAGMVDELLAPEEPPAARFEFGLEVLVGGLAAMVARGEGQAHESG